MALFDWDREWGFGDLGRLRREMNQLFSNFVPFGQGLSPAGQPPVNVYEDQDSVFVEAEIPDLDPGAMDLSVTGDTLTLKGRRAQTGETGPEAFHRRERPRGAFNRAVSLPCAVVGDQTEADYRHGVLRIRLPKAPEVKPRKIDIKVS